MKKLYLSDTDRKIGGVNPFYPYNDIVIGPLDYRVFSYVGNYP